MHLVVLCLSKRRPHGPRLNLFQVEWIFSGSFGREGDQHHVLGQVICGDEVAALRIVRDITERKSSVERNSFRSLTLRTE